MTDPGVADIPEEDEYDKDPDHDHKVKEKPSYVTRAVAVRERAGLNRELPCAARGVDERASDVIEIDDDDDWVQADIPMIEPPLKIKIEPEDITVESKPEQEVLGRGHRNCAQRVPFSPRMKGQRYKAVGFP